MSEQPTQKRPPNCGTGYCSCVECVMTPTASHPKTETAPKSSSHAGLQSDIETLEVENRLLRARNERLERELRDLAESVAKRLEQAGAGMQAGLIREVFITKSHP